MMHGQKNIKIVWSVGPSVTVRKILSEHLNFASFTSQFFGID
jgi:hypothetical protein